MSKNAANPPTIKKEIKIPIQEVDIPENVEVSYLDNVLTVKGPLGEVKREFFHPYVSLEVKDSKIIIKGKNQRRKTKAILGTWTSHVKNMIYGVLRGYEAKLKIVYVHFPMNVKVEGNEVLITNFMGGKGIRKAKILDGVDVKINKDEIIVKGIDIEKVGQTAANLEQSCRDNGGRDRRIFFDGIYITQKPKRSDEIWQNQS